MSERKEWYFGERMFEQRSSRPSPYPAWYTKFAGIVNQGAFPGMFGGMGGMALNQLLVTMDGIDNPPFWRRFWTNRFNNLLDATYVVPAVTATGVANVTVCQPDALSPENVPCPSSWRARSQLS